MTQHEIYDLLVKKKLSVKMFFVANVVPEVSRRRTSHFCAVLGKFGLDSCLGLPINRHLLPGIRPLRPARVIHRLLSIVL